MLIKGNPSPHYMKILYTTHSFSLPDQPGDARFYNIAKWFNDNGHEVTVFCSTRHQWNDKIIFNGTVENPQVFNGIKIVGLPTPVGRRRSKIRRILNYLALTLQIYVKGRKLPKHDMVIAGTPPLFTPLSSLLLAKKFGAFSVLEARDMHPKSAAASGVINNSWILKLWHKYEVTVRRKYDHVVVALPRMRKWLIEQGITEGKITTITNGYDSDNDQTVVLPSELKKYFAENQNKFIVGYFGSMGLGAWNVNAIAETAAALKKREEISFLFVGDGEQRSKVEAYIVENKLVNCHFFSSCARLEAANAMRMCNTLLMVYKDRNYEEILPVKLFDYMGTGRPSIFCGIGDGPDLLAKAHGGIVIAPYSVEKLADSIKHLADNPELCQQYGMNGRDYIEKHLLRKEIFEKWNEVVMKSRNHRR